MNFTAVLAQIKPKLGRYVVVKPDVAHTVGIEW
jgi:hypothetical protein